jgi:biotin operon repressor
MAKRTDVVDFVKTWQASSSRQQVADALGVTYGSIASREKTLRKAGVNLKEMQKQPRGIQIDANLLNSLIAQIDEEPSQAVAVAVTQE